MQELPAEGAVRAAGPSGSAHQGCGVPEMPWASPRALARCGSGMGTSEPAEPQLVGDGYLAAARADFLRRLGRTGEARVHYGRRSC